MPAPYLASSLVNFRNRINKAWPKRDKASDGWIGDAAHASRYSDHNPDDRGCVHAIDVDRDGIHPATVCAAAISHPATHYVIFDRKIYSREQGYRPVVYDGANPHTHHIHTSIDRTVTAEKSVTPWVPVTGSVYIVDPLSGWPPGTPERGERGLGTRIAQAYLNLCGAKLQVDGVFGPLTDQAVRHYQKQANLTVTGSVNRSTKYAMSTRPWGAVKW